MKINDLYRVGALIMVLVLAAFSVAGCDVMTGLMETQAPETTASAPTVTPAPTGTAAASNEPISLLIWLPPQFDPSGDSEASRLFQERLDAYTIAHPGLRVLVRIKAESGNASLLNTLQATSQAAPLALPDLALLSTLDMATAADSGLIVPFPTGYPAENDNDWYDIAAALGTHNEQRYGLPLAADALVMAYKPNQIEEVPTTWNDIQNGSHPLYFPAASTNAAFPLACYLAADGSLVSETGATILQEVPLTKMFNFIGDTSDNGVFPFWLTNYDSDDLSWQNFSEGSAVLAITNASRYFSLDSETIAAGPLPTPQGTPFTLMDGWVWTISTQDPNRQIAAAELATYLTQPEFTGEWTQEAGFLPLRPSALAVWQDGPEKSLGGVLLPAASEYPTPSTLAQVSAPISQAVIGILKGELSSAEAVQQVLSAVGQ